MPWHTDAQVSKHNHKAKSKKRKRQWRDVANSVLKRTGDDAAAVRIANGVVKKSLKKHHKKKHSKRVSKK